MTGPRSLPRGYPSHVGVPRDGVFPPGQGSRGSTGYAAGGMPLAFKQEDFLVFAKKFGWPNCW